MSDVYSRFMESGLYEEVVHSYSWAKQQSLARDLELFLNPADVLFLLDGEEMQAGYTVLGMPLRQSIGVEHGKCLIFDRQRGKYIRCGEPVDG